VRGERDKKNAVVSERMTVRKIVLGFMCVAVDRKE
jgi:hypothetical protein